MVNGVRASKRMAPNTLAWGSWEFMGAGGSPTSEKGIPSPMAQPRIEKWGQAGAGTTDLLNPAPGH